MTSTKTAQWPVPVAPATGAGPGDNAAAGLHGSQGPLPAGGAWIERLRGSSRSRSGKKNEAAFVGASDPSGPYVVTSKH